MNKTTSYPSRYLSCKTMDSKNLNATYDFYGSTTYSLPQESLSANVSKVEGYRYGFNSMEKDDEIKGEGNSYDFGARMYDSRVGRWLSRDKMEGKKPFLTPYQGFKNSPIVFIDPDGNDEFLTIIIKLNDGTTHTIENDRRISQKFIADGAWPTMNLFAVQDFRDIRTTVTYTQGENGAFTVSTTSVAEGNEKFLKEYIFPYDEGTIVDFSPFSLFGGGEKQKGGFRLTSEYGGAAKTKTISENDVESIDVGFLLSALGGFSSGLKGGKAEGLERFKAIFDGVEKLFESAEGMTTGEGNTETGLGETQSTQDVQGYEGDMKDSIDVKIISYGTKEGVTYRRQDSDSYNRGEPVSSDNSRFLKFEKR